MAAYHEAVDMALQTDRKIYCHVEGRYLDDAGQPGSDNDVVFAELIDTVILDGSSKSGSRTKLPGAMYRWQQWTASQGGSATTEQVDVLGVYDEEGWRIAYPGHRFMPATAPRLAAIFGRLAENETELAAVTNRLTEWLGTVDKLDNEGLSSGLVASANIIARSCYFSDYSVESPVVTELRQALETQSAVIMPHWISDSLGKMLIGNEVGSLSKGDVKNIDQAAIARAIEVYDKAGLVNDRLWLSFGVRAGGAVKNPDFLPVLYTKLMSEDGGRILENIHDSQLLLRAYITALLLRYQNEPDRHADNIKTILQAIRPGNDPARTVDLKKLVALSNKITPALNQERVTTSSEDLLSPLDPAASVHASDGLLRLLHLTRPAGISERRRAEQFEQDMLHSEVLSMLVEGARQRTARIIGYAALAFPNATPDQMRSLRRSLVTGVPVRDAMQIFRDQSDR